MGDWLQVHHCVLCADHVTAVRVYERLELAAMHIEGGRGYGPTGMRFGFWKPQVVLVTTTSKWGTA